MEYVKGKDRTTNALPIFLLLTQHLLFVYVCVCVFRVRSGFGFLTIKETGCRRKGKQGGKTVEEGNLSWGSFSKVVRVVTERVRERARKKERWASPQIISLLLCSDEKKRAITPFHSF